MSSFLRGGSDAFFDQRARAAMVAVTLVFGVFVFRLFQLQILHGEEHRQRSLRNSIRSIRLEAPRGEIRDREGRVLATTRVAFQLDLIPSEMREPDRTFAALSQLVGLDARVLRERLGAPRGRKRFQPVRLVADLGWPELARVESHAFKLPGVLTEVRPRRHYPQASLAAHVLGTIGEIGADQLRSRRLAGYEAGDLIGQSGVEALLEEQLHGRAGGRNVVVDVDGREVEVVDEVEPRPGGDVVLTLDLDLQRAAEEAFLEGDGEVGPASGALVALDPRNGDVLALASLPAFDPNDFAGELDPEAWKALTEDPHRPLQNRALAGQYPPGSTYKPFVAAAALEFRARKPEELTFCPGSFRLGRRTYRCWKRAGHGPVDLYDALVRSCDVYFYETGLLLGIDRLAEVLESFGFGHETGIPLPGEQPGLVPTSLWKERRFGEPWLKGETVSASIGQGFHLVTPLQLAVGYAALANGGHVLRPRLVLGLEGPQGVRPRSVPDERGRVRARSEHLDRIRRALVGVISERGGTGGRARLPGVAVAGKTGTAQVVRLEHTEGMDDEAVPRQLRDHAWFAAFAPAEAPEIVVAVLVEHGGHGGSAAAPIAQRVLARYFEKHPRASVQEASRARP